jgi:hypothetical protein
MKSALALVALATAATALPAEYVEANHELMWGNFKAEYGKTYAAAEEGRRMGIFKENMLRAAAMEAASKSGAQFGVNKFADLTAEEFKVYHNLRVPEAEESAVPQFSESERLRAKGESKDWRTAGAVTQIKDQGNCGSCWAFSTVGGVEGANFLHGTGKLISGSEQELVSCDKNDDGCDGGLMDQAFQWLIDSKKGQLTTEAAYPYRSGGGSSKTCKKIKKADVAATVKSFNLFKSGEDDLAAALIKSGPVSIAVDASSFQSYTGGVMDNCDNFERDHGVVAVGVTPDYWIIKNSWGSSWGESGFIRVARGKGLCLIGTYNVVPSV